MDQGTTRVMGHQLKGVNLSSTPSMKRGLAYAVACYTLWGLLPIYWNLLSNVGYLEVIGQRILWCFIFLFLISRFILKVNFTDLLRNKRSFLILIGCSLMVTATWCFYIYGVTSGKVIEVALGYYITPLFMILSSTLFFKERLSLVQKIATALVVISVVYLSYDYGRFPWLAVVLATLFGTYSSLKKLGGFRAIQGLTAESALALPLALAFIVFSFRTPEHIFLAPHELPGTLFLIGGGVVTAIPFLFFAQAANMTPLSWLGFVQYIEPTVNLLLGIFLFHETFTLPHLICFGVIWLGLIMVAAEMFKTLRA
jgi:chloramphenicol-sensitive protein RarD